MYTLNLTPAEAQVIWGSLMEQPGKTTFDVALKIKIQLDQQTAAAQAQTSVAPTLEVVK